MEYTIHADGGSRGNPGPAALGFTIEDVTGSTVAEGGKYLGVLTNNQAEYSAVIAALTRVREHRTEFPSLLSIRIVLDSELLVNQLSGTFKIKSRQLQHLATQVKSLEFHIGVPISYMHVPREENKRADWLVNKALDEHSQEFHS